MAVRSDHGHQSHRRPEARHQHGPAVHTPPPPSHLLAAIMQSLTVLALLGCVLFAGVVLAAPSPFRSTVNQPSPAQPDHGRRGEVSGGIDRQKGVGTVVHGRGSGDAWVSRDGNTRVNVGGHYGQVVGGPAKGAKDYGGHINVEHKF